MLRARLQKLSDRIAEAIGPFGHRVFTDSAPVLEAELAGAAARAGAANTRWCSTARPGPCSFGRDLRGHGAATERARHRALRQLQCA